MDDGVNVFSLSLRRKWSYLCTCGRGSVVCGTQQSLLNKGARGTAVASIAEAFGRGWTIGEC